MTKIVSMIEQSEKLKSAMENKASHLADTLWSTLYFAGKRLGVSLTRNVTRALSVLMVDFSCALKLAMPLAVLSAMREASGRHDGKRRKVPGGNGPCGHHCLFDKTGTLTRACPHGGGSDSFGGRSETDMLRLAACLEEHFPPLHGQCGGTGSPGQEAFPHEEMHSQVDYLVAHGIASTVGPERYHWQRTFCV